MFHALYNPTNILYLGEYWLDPNGGNKADAIKVHCKFTGSVETCIKPTTLFDTNEWNTKQNNQYNWVGQDVEPETSEVCIGFVHSISFIFEISPIMFKVGKDS